MRTVHTYRPLRTRIGAAAVTTAAVVGLAACGSDTAGPETGADVEDVAEDDAAVVDGEAEPAQETLDDEPLAEEPYVGPYDTAFAEDTASYVGQVVSLSADVEEVLTPSAFTVAGTDDTTVEELLVVGAATADVPLSPETTVRVTGTVQEDFTVTQVEAQLGAELDDALFEEWSQEDYVIADDVEVLQDAEG